ncbi:MAG TPA: beta-galactosidase trimerization domain-containing protein, partial [Puia sp.]|nr:beta-galactosidase trimerization domain-containing protein [Puia sp.]
AFSDSLRYNDIVRREYDALYYRNIGRDLVNGSGSGLGEYALIVVPPLYSVSDSLLAVLNNYVRQGGHVVYSCKSGFTDEHVQVRPSMMPGLLREAAGVSYQLFTNIGKVPLRGDPFKVGSTNEVHDWAEMLVPETAEVWGWYDHPYWGKYAAITHNKYGKGTVTYMGTIPSREVLDAVLMRAVKEAGIEVPEMRFPLIMRSGVNRFGRSLRYYFNYSGQEQQFTYSDPSARDVLSGKIVEKGQVVKLEPWGLIILESEGQWLDTDGRFINAHGAGVLFQDGIYYLFGEIKRGPTRLVPGQDWEDYRVEAGGVSCYSSRDLVHWKNEGVALAANTMDPASDIHTSRVIERPKVIYNEETKQYVLWMHVDRDDYSYARAGVAVSDKPQGPYRYIGSVRPNGQMSRDMTVFKDDDGRAYLVYTSENNNTMQVCLLSKDYLSPTPLYKRILVGQRREAPAVFKQDGKYFLITSLCTGWDPNPATYAVADSMMGTWTQKGNPCVGVDANTTFHSQSTFVVPHDSGFIFMADRWNKTDLERSGYLWLPLRVEGGKVEIKEEGLP